MGVFTIVVYILDDESNNLVHNTYAQLGISPVREVQSHTQ